MKKMQRNKPVRVAAILLVLMFVTAVALTGTLARYTSAATATSQYARVAAWKVDISFDYDGTNEATATWYKLNDAAVQPLLKLLGGTVLTHNLVTTLEHANATPATVWTNAETSNIKQDKYNEEYVDAMDPGIIPDFLFAPGTGGYINFAIRNQSEVPVTLDIDLGDADVSTLPNVIKVGYQSTGPIDATAMADAAGTLFTGSLKDGLPAVTGGGINAGVVQMVGIAWKWDYGTQLIADDIDNCGKDPEDTCTKTAGTFCPIHDGLNVGDFNPTVDAFDTGFGDTAADTPALYAALDGAKIVAVQLD